MQIPAHATQRGNWKNTHLPVSLCQAGESTLSRFSEARAEGQAVLDGEGTPPATHGP